MKTRQNKQKQQESNKNVLTESFLGATINTNNIKTNQNNN